MFSDFAFLSLCLKYRVVSHGKERFITEIRKKNVGEIQAYSLILPSVLRGVRKFFQSEFSTECHIVLLISISSNNSFP